MISVYVAGSSAKRERARFFMDQIKVHPGMRVTYDWVGDVDASKAKGVDDFQLSDVERARYANADLDGVAASDVFVLLAEERPTGRGMWVELGFVLALNEQGKDYGHDQITVIVSGGGRRSIFTAPTCGVDFEVPYRVGKHDGEAFAILEDLAAAAT